MLPRSRHDGVEEVHHARLKSGAGPTISLFGVVLFSLVPSSNCVQGVVSTFCRAASPRHTKPKKKAEEKKQLKMPLVNRLLLSLNHKAVEQCAAKATGWCAAHDGRRATARGRRRRMMMMKEWQTEEDAETKIRSSGTDESMGWKLRSAAGGAGS